jgi:hypothetical protein
MATGFQTKNKSIFFATVSTYRSQFIPVSGVKKAKASFEVSDSSLVGCGTISSGKSTFRSGLLLTSAGSNIGKMMEFYFKKRVISLV